MTRRYCPKAIAFINYIGIHYRCFDAIWIVKFLQPITTELLSRNPSERLKKHGPCIDTIAYISLYVINCDFHTPPPFTFANTSFSCSSSFGFMVVSL